MSAVDNLPDVLPPELVDGQLVLPDDDSTVDDGPVAITKDPKLIIREARQASYVEPNESHFENLDGDEYVYRYRKGLTYAVYACAMSALRIELASGEVLTNEPMIDDNRSRRRCAPNKKQCDTDVGWTISETPVMAGDGKGGTVAHLYLRPNNELVGRQYLHLATNIGPYRLRLEVLPTDDPSCMTAVRWRHPQFELKRLQAEQARRLRADELDSEVSAADDESRDITCASGQYEVQVAEGSPRWVPTQVSHVCVGDHPRVTIQFPREVAWTQWPTFAADGGVTGCRVVSEDYTIVCDHLFSGAMLALESQGRSERVYIRRLKEPR
jgi:hypothetical protein